MLLSWFFTSAYLYRLEEDYTYHVKTVEISSFFENEWMIVNPLNNQITIKSQYAWNGCSPKLNVFDLFVIGTPEGRINPVINKPFTYYASLVHDCNCQFKEDVPFTMDEITAIFAEMLQSWGRYVPTPVYVAAVKYFGPRK